MVSVSRSPGRTVCLLKCALFQVSRTGHSTPEQKPVPRCVNSAQGPEKSHTNSNLQVQSGTEKCNPKEGGNFMLCRSQKMRPPAFGTRHPCGDAGFCSDPPSGPVTTRPLWATVSMVAPTWCMYRNMFIYILMYKKEKKQTPVLIGFC